MRNLHAAEVGKVVGGENFPGPSREEVERQIQQLRDFLDEQARRNAIIQQ